MNKILLAAVAATLLAPGAAAQNGNANGSAPSSSGHTRHVSVAHVNAPPSHHGGSGSSGAGTSVVNPSNPALSGAAEAMAAAGRGPLSLGLSAPGGSRGLVGGGARRFSGSGGSFWGQRLAAIDAPPATPGSWGTGGSGNGMPSVLMPGQLIRTGGMPTLVSQPDAPPSLFQVGDDRGNKIAYDEIKGYALTNAPGLFVGPKDTLPPPNPLFGGSGAGGNGITENNTTNSTINSHSNNGNGNGVGGGN